jgi:hypothetical protein
MKLLILFIFSVPLLIDSKHSVDKVSSNLLIQIDSSKLKNISIIEYKPSFNNFLGSKKNLNSFRLSANEIELIDSIFTACLNDYNKKQEQGYIDFKKKNPKTSLTKDNFVIKGFQYYKRQYVPYINPNGEKAVWINCFCSSHDNSDWRKELVFVLDGGNCYFNLKINLKTRKYYDLMVNGDA